MRAQLTLDIWARLGRNRFCVYFSSHVVQLCQQYFDKAEIKPAHELRSELKEQGIVVVENFTLREGESKGLGGGGGLQLWYDSAKYNI